MRISATRKKGALSPRAGSSMVLGFIAIAALFFAIVAIWLAMVSNHNTDLQRINTGENQRQLIFTMRDAAYQRNLALFRMAALRDVFARDAEYLRFKSAAETFIVARQQLLASHPGDGILESWRRLKPRIQQSEKIQNTIVELITEDNNTSALNLIQSRFIPSQRLVSSELTKMLNSARDNIAGKLATASNTTRTQYQVILLLVLSATSIGYLIARSVLGRCYDAENVLLAKNRQIRAFTAITSDADKTVEEQIAEILRLGCEFLAIPCALLIRTEYGKPATVLSRFCGEKSGNVFLEQTLIDRLGELIIKIPNTVLTPQFLNSSDLQLSDELHRQQFSTLITAAVNTSDLQSTALVFIHNKHISPGDDTNELIQIIANKLAVLLDQQETVSQLQIAKQTAETANKTKNGFLNHITHKLQSPLNTIIGLSELLQEQMRSNDHSQYLNELGKIDSSSRRLRSLIFNLLDFTRLESGSMEFAQQAFDIEPLLEESVKILDPASRDQENQGHTARLNDLGMMIGDPAKIRQIVTSLLSFCENLCGPGKTLLTAWRELSPEDDWLYMEVQNNGSGICKKQINQLFKLTLPDSADRDNPSFGPQIDLAISKKLCELLGGNILVDSTSGGGTTFTVCLPCHCQQPNTAVPDFA